MEYPEIGETLKVHGTPWQFSETPPAFGRAPKLGEHNQAILEELGYSAEAIQNFVDQKII